MKKILINYADQQYYESQKVNSQSGRRVGGFTDVIEYNKSRLEPEFVSKNADIFKKGRGAGYWLWKPYIILKTLESASSEDLVFYCDAGATFVDSFDDYMFDLCREDDKGLILCNGGHVNKKWTKRDCFVFMDCDTPEYTDTLQLTATFQLCRKTDFTLDFYREHVQLAEDVRILTDDANTCGKDNYEGFIEHRHDQSILSNLQKKYGVTLVEDISQYGDITREEGYKRLVNHHRIKA